MNYNDELLSAFLDAELPEEQMQAVRDALAADAKLAERLAELALVNQRVTDHAAMIDRVPMPAETLALLGEAEPDPKRGADDRVTPFPFWRRFPQTLQRHAAAVAAISLLAGFVLARSLPTSDNADWAAIAAALDSKTSGQMHQVAGESFLSRLSFENLQGEYCRQFRRANATGAYEAIACRQEDRWTLRAMLPVDRAADPRGYVPASGGSALDDVLERMMRDQPIDAAREQDLITRRWSRPEATQ